MRFLALCLLFLTITFVIHAQSEEVETWPVIERCVSEPTSPPDDWSFDGTIIMYGDYGLHGIRADWDAPHILAFLPSFVETNGALSPNAEYYAAPNSKLTRLGNAGGQITVDGIYIWDTTDNPQPINTIPLKDSYAVGNQSSSIRQLRWIDDTHIIYEEQDIANSGSMEAFLEDLRVIDIFTGERELWTFDYNPTEYNYNPSPYLDFAYSEYGGISVINLPQGDILLDIPFKTSDLYFSDTWSRNSKQLAFIHISRDNSGLITNRELIIFDTKQASVRHIKLDVRETDIPIYLAWSSNNRYLALFEDTLQIFDFKTETIIDTCLVSGRNGVIWSPTEPILAIQQQNDAIVLLDFDNNTSYIVGYHASGYGRFVGWRIPSED